MDPHSPIEVQIYKGGVVMQIVTLPAAHISLQITPWGAVETWTATVGGDYIDPRLGSLPYPALQAKVSQKTLDTVYTDLCNDLHDLDEERP